MLIYPIIGIIQIDFFFFQIKKMDIYNFICSQSLLKPLDIFDGIGGTDLSKDFKELTKNNVLLFNKKKNNFKIENNKIKTKLYGNLISILKIKDYNYKKVYLKNKNLKIQAKKENNNWIFSYILNKSLFPNIDFYLVIELNNIINFDIDIEYLLVSDEIINNLHNYKYNDVYFDKNKKLRIKPNNFKELCYFNFYSE